jgi:hypothetical protein
VGHIHPFKNGTFIISKSLNAAPEAFDKDIVECATPAIHADDHTFAFEHIGESGTGVNCEP